MGIIGVDFDNTLADHRRTLHRVACELDFIDASVPCDKEAIKTAITAQGQADLDWRKVQALAYGPQLKESQPFEGALEALNAWAAAGHRVVIVSHKTPRSNHPDVDVDLHDAARGWLDENGISGGPVAVDDIHFCPTRDQKVAMIKSMECAVFVDDLPEVFAHPHFPAATGKILFSSEAAGAGPPDVLWAQSWDEIAHAVPREIVRRLPLVQSFAKQFHSIESVGRGGNNRVFLLDAMDGRKAVAKHYFRHPLDPRDRQATEAVALQFFEANGVDVTPRLLHADSDSGWSLLSRLDGRPAAIDGGDADALEQCVAFLGRLHSLRTHAPATIPAASEATFSTPDLLAVLDQRIHRVREANHPATARFLESDLVPAQSRITKSVLQSPSAMAPIEPSHRTLSPSDFGLHNALVHEDGTLRFLDFEYFGWDDPAKTISDFVLHPGMNLSNAQRRKFADAMLQLYDHELLRERTRRLMPIHALKWATILLNPFTRIGASRRRFAATEVGGRHDQLALEKASRMVRQAIDLMDAPYI